MYNRPEKFYIIRLSILNFYSKISSSIDHKTETIDVLVLKKNLFTICSFVLTFVFESSNNNEIIVEGHLLYIGDTRTSRIILINRRTSLL